MQRIWPIVAKMEFPVRIKRKVFARRIGRSKLGDPQRGARTGNKSANDWNDFNFQIQIGDKFGDTSNVCAANQHCLTNTNHTTASWINDEPW